MASYREVTEFENLSRGLLDWKSNVEIGRLIQQKKKYSLQRQAETLSDSIKEEILYRDILSRRIKVLEYALSRQREFYSNTLSLNVDNAERLKNVFSDHLITSPQLLSEHIEYHNKASTLLDTMKCLSDKVHRTLRELNSSLTTEEYKEAIESKYLSLFLPVPCHSSDYLKWSEQQLCQINQMLGPSTPDLFFWNSSQGEFAGWIHQIDRQSRELSNLGFFDDILHNEFLMKLLEEDHQEMLLPIPSVSPPVLSSPHPSALSPSVPQRPPAVLAATTLNSNPSTSPLPLSPLTRLSPTSSTPGVEALIYSREVDIPSARIGREDGERDLDSLFLRQETSPDIIFERDYERDLSFAGREEETVGEVKGEEERREETVEEEKRGEERGGEETRREERRDEGLVFPTSNSTISKISLSDRITPSYGDMDVRLDFLEEAEQENAHSHENSFYDRMGERLREDDSRAEKLAKEEVRFDSSLEEFDGIELSQLKEGERGHGGEEKRGEEWRGKERRHGEIKEDLGDQTDSLSLQQKRETFSDSMREKGKSSSSSDYYKNIIHPNNQSSSSQSSSISHLNSLGDSDVFSKNAVYDKEIVKDMKSDHVYCVEYFVSLSELRELFSTSFTRNGRNIFTNPHVIKDRLRMFQPASTLPLFHNLDMNSIYEEWKNLGIQISNTTPSSTPSTPSLPSGSPLSSPDSIPSHLCSSPLIDDLLSSDFDVTHTNILSKHTTSPLTPVFSSSLPSPTWNLSTRLSTHLAPVRATYIDPSMSLLLSSSDDTTIKAYDLRYHLRNTNTNTNNPNTNPTTNPTTKGDMGPISKDEVDGILTMRGSTSSVYSLAYDISTSRLPNGGGVVYGGNEDGEISVWRLPPLDAMASLMRTSSGMRGALFAATYVGHEGPVWSLDVHQSLGLLLSASGDGSVKVWPARVKSYGSGGPAGGERKKDERQSYCVDEARNNGDRPSGAQWIPSEPKGFVSCTTKGRVLIYDIEKECLSTEGRRGEDDDRITCMKVNNTLPMILTGHDGGESCLWDVRVPKVPVITIKSRASDESEETGQVERKRDQTIGVNKDSYHISSVGFDFDSFYFATTSSDGYLYYYDIRSQKVLYSTRLSRGNSYEGICSMYHAPSLLSIGNIEGDITILSNSYRGFLNHSFDTENGLY